VSDVIARRLGFGLRDCCKDTIFAFNCRVEYTYCAVVFEIGHVVLVWEA
jgi:hypothetical protein